MNRTARLWALVAAAWAPAVFGETPSLSLREAVRLAVANAPGLASSLAERDAAASGAALAADAFHPFATVGTTPGYATGMPVAVLGDVPAIASVGIRQLIYDPAKSAEALEADALRLRAEASAVDARRELLVTIGGLYERVRRSAERVERRRSVERARQTIAARAAALAREGRIGELDSRRAALGADESALARRQAEAEAVAAATRLARLIGARSESLPSLSDDALAILPAVPTAAPEEDRSIALLLAAVDLLGQAERSRSRLFSPTVAAETRYLRLSSGYGYDKYFNHFKNDDWSIGVSAQLPLWTGGVSRDAASRTRADRAAFEGALRTRRDALEVEAEAGRREDSIAGERLDLARQAASIAGSALEAASALAKEGRGDANGVEEAAIALAEAGDRLDDAAEAAVSARLRALSAAGSLTEESFAPASAGGRAP